MAERWGRYSPMLWTALSLLVALAVGPWGFAAAVVSLLLVWAYSVPPLRLKRNGWWGNAAYGLCYEGFAWTIGAAVMAGGAMPEPRSLALALLYSVSAHGIMTLNDFTSIQGDRQMGIGSLPVLLGIDNAARAACSIMIAPQLLVVGLLALWQRPPHALTVAALIASQLLLMRRFRHDPTANAVWYSGFGVPLLLIGMMVSAFGLRGA
jgi:chlorophyll/bacteriochlorophyll a synthase